MRLENTLFAAAPIAFATEASIPRDHRAERESTDRRNGARRRRARNAFVCRIKVAHTNSYKFSEHLSKFLAIIFICYCTLPESGGSIAVVLQSGLLAKLRRTPNIAI
jgi:hypothetical protein